LIEAFSVSGAPRDYRRDVPWGYRDRYPHNVVDFIDIHVTDDELIAVRGGRSTSREQLKLSEKVLSKKSRGFIGAALTNQRLLVVSKRSPGWLDLELRLAEAPDEKPPEILLSDYLLLLATKTRIIGFDSFFSRFVVSDLPIHDQLGERVIDDFVAVVTTTGSAFGLAKGASRFVEKPFKRNERLLSIETSSYNVTLRTSRRLLIFKSRGAFWEEIDAD
jgi:hypothetical protein